MRKSAPRLKRLVRLPLVMALTLAMALIVTTVVPTVVEQSAPTVHDTFVSLENATDVAVVDSIAQSGQAATGWVAGQFGVETASAHELRQWFGSCYYRYVDHWHSIGGGTYYTGRYGPWVNLCGWWR